jgi:hypothetical protein
MTLWTAAVILCVLASLGLLGYMVFVDHKEQMKDNSK